MWWWQYDNLTGYDARIFPCNQAPKMEEGPTLLRGPLYESSCLW